MITLPSHKFNLKPLCPLWNACAVIKAVLCNDHRIRVLEEEAGLKHPLETKEEGR